MEIFGPKGTHASSSCPGPLISLTSTMIIPTVIPHSIPILPDASITHTRVL